MFCQGIVNQFAFLMHSSATIYMLKDEIEALSKACCIIEFCLLFVKFKV